MAAPWEKYQDTKEAAPWEKYKESEDGITAKGLLRGALKALPAAGGLAGGVAGTILGPMGTVGGAGLGAVGGKALQDTAEKYFFDEGPQTREQQYRELAKSGLEGLTSEMGGQVLGKVVSSAGGLLKNAGPKVDAAKIANATEELGAKATPGMLSNSPYTQKIQSSLEQSPALAGALTRRETTPVYNAIKTGTEDVFKDVAQKPASEVGSQIKEGIREVITKRLTPVKAVYDDIRASTEFIDLGDKSKAAVAKNIMGIDQFKNSPARPVLQGVAEDLASIKTVDELKQLKSLTGKRLNSFESGTPEYAALSQAYGKLAGLEERTIMREAVKQARTSKEGAKIGKQLVSDLKKANKDYRGIFEDLGIVSKKGGLSRGDVKSVDMFLERLDDVPDEKIAEKLLDVKDRKFMVKMKELFPDQFEQIRQSRLNFIRDKSVLNGEINPKNLLRNVKDLEPATKELLFGKDSAKVLDNLQTVVNSLPDKVGPSGTPAGIEWMELLNPLTYPREVARLAQYGLLKNPNIGSKVFNNTSKGLLQAAPKAFINGK